MALEGGSGSSGKPDQYSAGYVDNRRYPPHKQEDAIMKRTSSLTTPIMLIFSIIYLVLGFYIILFPDKFKRSVEKSSGNGIKIIGLIIAGVSIINFAWMYIMLVVTNLR